MEEAVAKENWVRWMKGHSNEDWGSRWDSPAIGEDPHYTPTTLNKIKIVSKLYEKSTEDIVQEIENRTCVDVYRRVRIWEPSSRQWEREDRCELLSMIRRNVEDYFSHAIDLVKSLSAHFEGHAPSIVKAFEEKKYLSREIELRIKDSMAQKYRNIQKEVVKGQDPNILPMAPTHVVDLLTGSVRERDISDFFVYQVAQRSLSSAEVAAPPQIADWFRECPIQLILGSFLIGSHDTCFYIFYGKGSNGKSTLLAILEMILGEYCVKIPARLLYKHDTSDLENKLELRYKRLAILDLREDANISINKLVHLTDKYANLKIVLSLNYIPKLDLHSYSAKRRLVYVPFDYKFVAFPKEAHEKARQKHVQIDYDHFFSWMLQGSRRYLSSGQTIFQLCPSIEKYADSLHYETDDVKRFLDDTVAVCAKQKVKSLYDAYTRWNKIENLEPCLTPKLFYEKVKETFKFKRFAEGYFFLDMKINRDY